MACGSATALSAAAYRRAASRLSLTFSSLKLAVVEVLVDRQSRVRHRRILYGPVKNPDTVNLQCAARRRCAAQTSRAAPSPARWMAVDGAGTGASSTKAGRGTGAGDHREKERVIAGRDRAGECRRPGDRRGHKVVDGQGLKGSENAQVDVARYLVKIVERRGTGAAGELGFAVTACPRAQRSTERGSRDFCSEALRLI